MSLFRLQHFFPQFSPHDRENINIEYGKELPNEAWRRGPCSLVLKSPSYDRCGGAGSMETELSASLCSFWFGHLGSSNRNYRWGMARVAASMARNSKISKCTFCQPSRNHNRITLDTFSHYFKKKKIPQGTYFYSTLQLCMYTRKYSPIY